MRDFLSWVTGQRETLSSSEEHREAPDATPRRIPPVSEVQPRRPIPDYYVACVTGLKSETDEERTQEEFHNILGHARSIAREDPTALADLVRLLAREIEARYATLALSFEGDAPHAFWLDDLSPWFSNLKFVDSSNRTFSDFRREVEGPKPEIRLGIDPVIPGVWSSQRLENTLTSIGKDRPDGPWLQDDNHRVELWMPLGIGIVTNGNHSIAAGIAQCQGILVPTEVYDISEIYEYVQCDGRFFYSSDWGTLGPVLDARWAAVFEIGRMMQYREHTSC